MFHKWRERRRKKREEERRVSEIIGADTSPEQDDQGPEDQGRSPNSWITYPKR
ncbi:MAG TPA: hypothetical protein VEM41_03980 [Actinomycetota bacterium]|nr:hypothetical protein [Actinomycetota bacterium]